MTNINIGFTATHDWLKYTLVTATSILINANNNDNYCFYIISNKFNDKIKNDFLLLNKIKISEWHFIETDDSLYSKITHNHLGSVSCYRLIFSSVTNADKLLYIDSDILAMSDVAELYNYDISEYYLAAIEDKQFDMRLIVGFSDDEIYFNGGVQLINLKKFREDNLVKSIFYILERKHWTDQDVINSVCRGKILSLPLKFNIMQKTRDDNYKNREEEYNKAINNPVLMHFSQQKPWKQKFTETPYLSNWFKYEKIFLELKSNSKA